MGLMKAFSIQKKQPVQFTTPLLACLKKRWQFLQLLNTFYPIVLAANIFSFFFFQNLSSIFSETAADRSVSIALQNCLLKAKLFMGHRVRVVNQQRAIKALYEMKIHCIEKGFSEIALIIIDFKMKLDPIYWREKTVDHYGKRGMSWHGALIQYYTMVEGVPTLSKFYLDQICENDNKQDKFAVISLVEAILLELKRHHPQIRKVIFQSDNAGCYQNSMHLYLFPYLSYIHGIQIDRFVHTETQDGKSLLDAHFARLDLIHKLDYIFLVFIYNLFGYY